MRYFVELAFDGSQYHGWQKQINDETNREFDERDLFTRSCCSQ